MTQKRIKISATYGDFSKQMKSLRKFDSTNQTNFQNNDLSKKQLHLLTESIFFNAFRDYENLVRDIFILYTQEKKRTNGRKVKSYIQPKDFFHAENLIKSSMPFLFQHLKMYFKTCPCKKAPRFDGAFSIAASMISMASAGSRL